NRRSPLSDGCRCHDAAPARGQPPRPNGRLTSRLRGRESAPLREQILRELRRAGGVGRVAVGADRVRILLRDGRAADQDDHVVAQPGLLERVDVRLEHRHRRRQEGREADDVGLVLDDLLDERLRRDLDAEVDDLETGALEHDVDEVLADVVHVALDRAHEERADRLHARVGQERPEQVERARHRAAGDQHLGDEEVAALEACADLLERRDQRVEQHRLRPEALLEAALGQLDDGRLVADERPVVELGQDLVVVHASSSPPYLFVRMWLLRASAASTTISESSASRSRVVRTVGADTEIAAMTVPLAPRIGAAVEQSPSSSSSHVVAYPWRRTCSSSASRSPMLVIVFGPRRASRPNGGCAALNAMKTLPSDEACGGIRRPTQLPAPSGWRLSTCASRATPLGVGIATFAVSPVVCSSRSRNGSASVARSPTGASRRAYSTSTGPGRNPPPGRRCASPLRSSARRSRAAVDFGSCVSSMTPESVTASSLSTRRTRIRAARSIDCAPFSNCAICAISWHSACEALKRPGVSPQPPCHIVERGGSQAAAKAGTPSLPVVSKAAPSSTASSRCAPTERASSTLISRHGPSAASAARQNSPSARGSLRSSDRMHASRSSTNPAVASRKARTAASPSQGA